MLNFRRLLFTFSTTAMALGLGSTAIHAQAPADFFKGKTLTYVVATAPGGGYDSYARLITEYMQKNLPGVTIVGKSVV